MDSYDFVDTVKAEKANALARYRRFKNISKMFQLIEVFVAVALISWSSTRLPSAFRLSGEYMFSFSSYLLNQHVVFLVGNVIVVLCYVLSPRADIGDDAGGSENYEDNRNSSPNHQKTTSVASNEEFISMRGTMQTAGDDHENQTLLRNENVIVKAESEMEAETAIKQAAKQIERFQRTQSAKLKREISTKPRRELRRSATERRSGMVVTSDRGGSTVTSFETVETLSNEEFRLAVEAFISKQQSILKGQRMVENDI